MRVSKTRKEIFSLSARSILIALIIGLSLVASSTLQFDVGFKGPIVETNPLYWIILAVGIVYLLLVRKKYVYSSLIIIFFIGLSLRLIPATHSLYPGYDPWNELASIHRIQATGFNLLGNYYHSSLPVLQMLLIFFIPLFGEYNTIVYFGPVFGWVLAFICLYKLGREFFSTEKTLLVLLLYACLNISAQYLTTPETIALGIGFATVFLFHRTLAKPSVQYSVATIAVFTLLVFTHHLTALSVLAATGAITIILMVKKVRTTTLLVWLSMLLIFFAYFQLYQHMLSNLLILQIEQPLIGVPTGWPKPIWWWILYVAPKAFLFSLLGAWIVPFVIKKKIPKPDEIFGMVSTGGFLILLGFLIPTDLPPLRVLNQFGGYFSNGVASLKRSNILIIALAAILLMGVVTEFPMTNMSNFYVGGYWISHSSQEVSAIQYLAANATFDSRIAIDGRCRGVLAGLASPQKELTPVTSWDVFDVYNTTSTEEAWTVCTHNNYTYVFVSEFYKIIAHFDVYGAAEKFSENQLSKFSSPYFSLWYKNSEVAIYLVASKV
jgi:hypothetical protein